MKLSAKIGSPAYLYHMRTLIESTINPLSFLLTVTTRMKRLVCKVWPIKIWSFFLPSPQKRRTNFSRLTFLFSHQLSEHGLHIAIKNLPRELKLTDTMSFMN